ncbi:MAG: hypothetical protein K2Y05_12590 [Hyphomicrobiaceae bacterium]|nr:hypothetical protein [Hyphomicrobiaceae bacterium]
MIANAQPVRLALKTLHDPLVKDGSPVALLQADLALPMAVDHLNVASDYDGLCQAIEHYHEPSIDRLSTRLSPDISEARKALGETGEFKAPW